jgi:hypothetical protein
MTFTADPRVDAYIDSLSGWQPDICRKMRARPDRPPTSGAIRRDNTMLIMKDSHMVRNQL